MVKNPKKRQTASETLASSPVIFWVMSTSCKHKAAQATNATRMENARAVDARVIALVYQAAPNHAIALVRGCLCNSAYSNGTRSHLKRFVSTVEINEGKTMRLKSILLSGAVAAAFLSMPVIAPN